MKEHLSRGEIISLIAGVPAIVAAGAGTASAADTEAAKAMKKSLGYIDKSKVKDDCDDCRFYKKVTKTDGTCAIIGKCQTRPYHMSIMYTDKLSDSAKTAIRDSLYTRRGGLSFGPTVRLTRMLVCFTTGLPPEEWVCPKEIKLE